MVQAIVDRIPTQELMQRYNLESRTAIANRIKALGIAETRDGKKLYVPVEALEPLDALNKCLERPGTTLEECASLINGGAKSPPDSQLTTPNSPILPFHLSPFIQLVHEIASALRPQQDPLAPLVSLSTAADNGWLLTTQQVKALVGVYPKGETYTRGSFVFVKSGKIGNQTAWRVEKVEFTDSTIMTESVLLP